MNLPVKAIAILLLVAPSAFAQVNSDACVFDPESSQSCVHLVGCIDGAGEYFYGRSVGLESGTVTGRTSEGESCFGTWQNDTNKSRGESVINCGPEQATFKYFPRGKDFNVISGVAVSDKGRHMITWAGEDLRGYLKVKFPDSTHPGFQCGTTWIDLPDHVTTPPKPNASLPAPSAD